MPKVTSLIVTFSAAIFLLLTTDNVVNGCTCAEINRTQQFCNQDFVARVTLNEKSELKSKYDSIGSLAVSEFRATISYSVFVKNVFRTSERFINESINASNGATWKLTSYKHSATCGLDLSRGDGLHSDYLISGYIRDGDLWIHLCAWNMAWKKLNDEEKDNLESGWYEAGCQAESPSEKVEKTI